MKYKYQADLDATPETCPPDNFVNKDIEAFRWVFDELENIENFKPLAKKNPARVLSMDDKSKCIAYSLSMFNSQEAAKSRFEFLHKTMKDKAYKLLGTKIAKGNIEKNHGVNSNSGKNGHFSHFQYQSVDFTTIFKVVEILK